MFSGERKKFELRAGRTPMTVAGLSNTVLVYQGEDVRFGFIRFAPCFAQAVGAKMPRGISEFEPAFVQVVFDAVRKLWTVMACYVSTWQTVTLWTTEQKPSWLKELKSIRYNHHEHNKANPAAHRAPLGRVRRPALAQHAA